MTKVCGNGSRPAWRERTGRRIQADAIFFAILATAVVSTIHNEQRNAQ